MQRFSQARFSTGLVKELAPIAEAWHSETRTEVFGVSEKINSEILYYMVCKISLQHENRSDCF